MSQSDSLVGKVIGNYEILRELGRGGMGVVYKAHEQSLQRVVALKILPRHLAENPAFVKRFLREARAGARLNHPNIVTTYAVGEHDGVYFIAMEYIKGAPLSQVIRDQGQLDIRRALDISRQAAQALAQAHGQGIIHRDIKPQNMMIDQAGRVKVMDFGLAKVLHAATELTVEGAKLGTPLYMSPEQAQGQTVDARTDIYSLGIVLFEMLAGAPPFLADSPVAVLHQIIHQPVPDLRALNSDVPIPVARLVARMTAKDPKDRHPSAEALDRDLATVLSGDEKKVLMRDNVREEAPSARIEPRQSAAPPRRASFPRRKSVMTAAVVLIGIAAAFGIGKLTGVSSPKGQAPKTQDISGTSVSIVGSPDKPQALEKPVGAVTQGSRLASQAVTDFVVGQPLENQQLLNSRDTKSYRCPVSGTGPLFVHLDKPSSWESRVALYRETLNSALVQQNASYDNLLLMLDAPEPGTYYVQVSGGTGTFTLTLTRSLPELTIGRGMKGQIPQSHYIAWYHVAVTGGGPLFVRLDKPSSWESRVRLYRETLNKQPVKQASSYDNLLLMLDAPEPGTYYVQVSGGTGTFTRTLTRN